MEDFYAKHKHLYDTPLEALGLSEATNSLLRRIGFTSVGDCIDAYCLPQPDIAGAIAEPPERRAMNSEVKSKLKALGFRLAGENTTD